MNNFIKNKKAVLVVILVLAVLILFLVFLQRISRTGVSVLPAPQAPASVQNPSASPNRVGQNVSASAVSSFIVMPVAGDQWVLGKTHEIRWNRAGVNTGGIELLNAQSRSVIGLITPNISAGQVMYNWDTNFIALSRTNPLKNLVSAGTYIVRIFFDGSHASIDSAPFQIIETGIDRIITSEVFIQNEIFVPNFLALAKGGRVAIINGDNQMAYILEKNNVPLASLHYGDAYVFDTSSVSAGTYEFKIKENAIASFDVTVSQ